VPGVDQERKKKGEDAARAESTAQRRKRWEEGKNGPTMRLGGRDREEHVVAGREERGREGRKRGTLL